MSCAWDFFCIGILSACMCCQPAKLLVSSVGRRGTRSVCVCALTTMHVLWKLFANMYEVVFFLFSVLKQR